MNSRNKSDPFTTDHLLKDLKAHSARSTAFTAFAQGIKFIIHLISIAVLARLLQPSDFGLIAMATVMTGLVGVVGDGGLSMATIQRAVVTHGQVSNLFWFNVVLGLALSIMTVAMAPIVAFIYGEPRLIWICVAISATFIIRGLSVQHSALLVRQMRFKTIAYIDVISMTCGVVASIGVAWFGLGYWALVVLPLCTALSQVICTWLLSDWRPSWWRRGAGAWPLLNFGATLTGSNFVGYIASNITPFVVGLIGGPQQLGLYNRANTLTAIPSTQILQPIMSVAQPALARVAADPKRFRSAALSLMRKICLLAMFITVTMAVMAHWIVAIFLGPGWSDTVWIFQLLAIFALIEPIASTLAMILIAAGRADILLRSKLISLASVIVSTIIGSLWGVFGIATAFALSGLLIRAPLFFWFACRVLPLSQFDIYSNLAPFVMVGLITGLLLGTARFFGGSLDPVFALCTYTALSAMIYLGLSLLHSRSRGEVIEIWHLFLRKL